MIAGKTFILKTLFLVIITDSNIQVDGTAWMAERRKRQSQEEERERMERQRLQQEHHEEARNRRKSQLSALKVRCLVVCVNTVSCVVTMKRILLTTTFHNDAS